LLLGLVGWGNKSLRHLTIDFQVSRTGRSIILGSSAGRGFSRPPQAPPARKLHASHAPA
jgi:hypothetical protein